MLFIHPNNFSYLDEISQFGFPFCSYVLLVQHERELHPLEMPQLVIHDDRITLNAFENIHVGGEGVSARDAFSHSSHHIEPF